MCKAILDSVNSKIETKFGYEINTIEYTNDIWLLNKDISAKNIIFTSGSEVSLIDQFYLKIRPVWGQRIDISTTTSFSHNYHKACSISQSKSLDTHKHFVSIGATHHRDKKGIKNISENSMELLTKANEIKQLDDVEVLNHYIGARACSIDYFPIVGNIIDAKTTLDEFPYLVNGTHVEPKRFTQFKNLHILTGVGGRGFVLAPYLAHKLVNSIIKNEKLDKSITIDRLFQREVKRHTNPLGI
jgi:glycine/D-amino acid oxidase-like deaminating enzyme